MPKCGFNKVALQFVFPFKFGAYFQNPFSKKPPWKATSEIKNSNEIFKFS